MNEDAIETGKEIRRFKGHSDNVLSVAFSPDGRKALSGSADKTLRQWNVRIGEEIRRFKKAHPKEITSVVFSPKDGIIASGSRDDNLCFWKVRTGDLLYWVCDIKGDHAARLFSQ
jgi:WD40 repeat protein